MTRICFANFTGSARGQMCFVSVRALKVCEIGDVSPKLLLTWLLIADSYSYSRGSLRGFCVADCLLRLGGPEGGRGTLREYVYAIACIAFLQLAHCVRAYGLCCVFSGKLSHHLRLE